MNFDSNKIVEGRHYCHLLEKEIDTVTINNVKYANFNTSAKWLPKKWLSGSMNFDAIAPEKMNRLRYTHFVDVESGINFRILQPSFDKDGNANFQICYFDSKESFDLTKKDKRARAFILAHQRFIEGFWININKLR